MKIAVYGPLFNERSKSTIQTLISYLKRREARVVFEKNFHASIASDSDIDLNAYAFATFEVLDASYDLLISIGGDGTILRAITFVKDLEIHEQKYIVLDDSADIFINKVKSSNKIYEKTCVYIGSFYQGKGIEIISELAKILPEVNFHLYGDFSVLKERNIKIKTKNIKLVKKLKYKDVNSVLKKYHIALMPYQKKIMAKSKNLLPAN